MKKPPTQKKDSHFKNGLIEKSLTPSITSHPLGLLSPTESLLIHVSTTRKQLTCFVYAYHDNISSIKINFKSLTVSLHLQVTFVLPAILEMGAK